MLSAPKTRGSFGAFEKRPWWATTPDDELDLLKRIIVFAGLPVEEEEDRVFTQPWVTWLGIALCILVSLWSFKNFQWALDNLSFVSTAYGGEYVVRMLTSFFVHGSFFHLLGNMYFFWIFGDNVEDCIGKPRYLLLLALACVVACLSFDKFHPGDIPAVGASGGISGILSFYLVRFPRRRFVVRHWFHGFSIPAYVLGVLFLAKEIYGASLNLNMGSTGVAHLAHLGGAAVGIFFAYVWAPRDKKKDPTT